MRDVLYLFVEISEIFSSFSSVNSNGKKKKRLNCILYSIDTISLSVYVWFNIFESKLILEVYLFWQVRFILPLELILTWS